LHSMYPNHFTGLHTLSDRAAEAVMSMSMSMPLPMLVT
jgi:hypothetical protein